MLLQDGLFPFFYLWISSPFVDAIFCQSRRDRQIDHWLCLRQIFAEIEPLLDENAVWVVILRLLDRVVHAGGIDASRARLHLHLTPVNAGFVVQKLSREPFTNRPPVKPQRVGRHRNQHGSHTEIQPAGFAQHHNASIDHRPAGSG